MIKVYNILLFVILCIEINAGDLKVSNIVDKKLKLDATVITIDKKSNKFFSVLNIPNQTLKDNINNYWDKKKYILMVNGGYFNSDFTSTGFYKIDDGILQPKIKKSLSGFVAIDKNGSIKLLTLKDDLKDYPTIIQSGPYVIDPGGKVGINTRKELVARRTLIGETREGNLIILITKPITLYDLAYAIKKKIPNIERLLNLDGGPSTALKTKTVGVVNRRPVKNYIIKSRK